MIKRTLQKGEKVYVQKGSSNYFPVTFEEEISIPGLLVKTATGSTMRVSKETCLTEEEFKARVVRRGVSDRIPQKVGGVLPRVYGGKCGRPKKEL